MTTNPAQPGEFVPLHRTDVERHLAKAEWLIEQGRGGQKEHAPIVVQALAHTLLDLLERVGDEGELQRVIGPVMKRLNPYVPDLLHGRDARTIAVALVEHFGSDAR